MASLNISYPPNGFEKTKINAPNTLILNNNLATKSRVDARGHFYLRKKDGGARNSKRSASYNERIQPTESNISIARKTHKDIIFYEFGFNKIAFPTPVKPVEKSFLHNTINK